MKIRLILKGDAVQIGEDEFYNPWRTVDLYVPDDLMDIKHEHIVGAVVLDTHSNELDMESEL